MVVGVVWLDLRLFDIHSLKQKRSQVSRILNRLRSRFSISIVEVGHQDLLQRAILGGSLVAGKEAIAQSVFRQIEEELYASGSVELINMETEILNYGEEIH
jgi:uncharacterized protein YlxP (DUF503 family)